MKSLSLFFALIMMVMSWELPTLQAAWWGAGINSAGINEMDEVDPSQRLVTDTTDKQIPDESIRLRIIANSDSVADQMVKKKVRDRIIERISSWATELESLEEARTRIRERLPELEKLVDEELKRWGMEYTSQIELGVVPFPTKIYGNEVYPAGNYEALRVQLGEAKGQNWWCVLFPPLCFVDFTAAEGEGAASSKASATGAVEAGSSDQSSSVEVGFFLWEWFSELLS